jgi:hypothetical protein
MGVFGGQFGARLGARRVKALSVAIAFTATLAHGPALAEIAVSVARISEGQLWVIGQVDEPNATVTLDQGMEQTADGRGRFEFRVVYHPATCIVTLKTSSQLKRAVVAGCGQAGPKGEAGLPGPAGPPGAPGGRVAEETGDGQAPRATVSTPSRGPEAPTSPLVAQAVAPPARATVPPPLALGPAVAPVPEGARPPAPTEAPRRPPTPTPAAVTGPPALGEWTVEDGAARIGIQPCGANLCGAVVWSKEGGELGTQILRSMKPAGQNKWEGTIFDPTSGKTYQSSITLQNPNTLRVEGCVLGFLCGGQTWTRAR